MNKIERIKKDLLVARKAKDILSKNLLTTFIGEFDNQSKDVKGSPILSNDLVHVIAKKMVKSATLVNTDDAREEIKILEQYLPQMASKAEVIEFLKDKDLTLGGRLIGEAKKHFDGNVDPALVKQSIALLQVTE